MKLPRHRRQLDARRDTVRRMLAAGALVGLFGGLVSQWLVGGVGGDLRVLVRVALLLPVAIFVIWWMLFPGVRADRDETILEEDAAPAAMDVDARLQRIEEAFDHAAVPHAGTHDVEPPDAEVRDELHRSIRRTDQSRDTERFGVRPPEPPAERVTNG